MLHFTLYSYPQMMRLANLIWSLFWSTTHVSSCCPSCWDFCSLPITCSLAWIIHPKILPWSVVSHVIISIAVDAVLVVEALIFDAIYRSIIFHRYYGEYQPLNVETYVYSHKYLLNIPPIRRSHLGKKSERCLPTYIKILCWINS